MIQSEPQTFAEALRQYYQRYPRSSPKEATLAACKALELRLTRHQFLKKLNEARQIKYRLKKRAQDVNIIRCDRSEALKGVGNAEVAFDVHRVVFSGIMPGWLIASVARAAEVGFAGWRIANVRAGVLVCELEKLGFRKYRFVAYRSSGFMTVFPLRRRYDYEDLKTVFWSNLFYVLKEMGPEDRAQPDRIERYHLELIEFRDEVFAQVGGHVAFKEAGMKNVVPFRIRVRSRGLNVRHDGSDPDCIELEVDPQRSDFRGALKEIVIGFEELSKRLDDLTKQQDDLREISREIASGLKELSASLRLFGQFFGSVGRVTGEADWSRYN